MKVLRAIGNFFVKIWKWIVKTAWIQPLLIVGLLFGIIFSIPPIVDAIKNKTDNTNPLEFLEKYSAKWDGINNGAAKDSEVEKLVDQVRIAIENGSGEIGGGYSQKFFLTFSQTGCGGCADLSKAMNKLSDEWNKSFKPENTGESFKLYNIEADYELEDPKEENFNTLGVANKDLWAFNTLMTIDSGLVELIEVASERGESSAFYLNGGVTNKGAFETSISEMILSTGGGSDITAFKTPVILLMDFTEEGREISGGTGVREVFFGVQMARGLDKTNTDVAHAQFLLNAWNSAKEFSDNIN